MDEDLTGAATKRAALGEILVRLGVITPEQLAEALPHCDPGQRNLIPVLVELGFGTEEALLKAISVRHRVPYFTSLKGLLDPGCAKLIPPAMARRHLAIPIRQTPRGLMVAMVNPLDIVAVDTIASHTKMRVLAVLTTRRTLFATINTELEPEGPPPELEKPKGEVPGVPAAAPTQVKIIPRAENTPMLMHSAEGSSVVAIVDRVISEAVGAGGSDIHLEPGPNAFRMRLRVDGLLQGGRAFPKDMEQAIVARIKILSGLDITETRLPQDGHISVDYGGKGVDLRISTLPTIYGEKVVIRVLDQSKSRKSLETLGFPPHIYQQFSNVIRRPNGLLLVTGPTGSGKTTTLYAALNEINTVEKNIVTLEDPVEYRLAGLTQMETNDRIQLSFATGLRAILRQDPNVILVGEIRDQVTAEIAVQAAVTGHFVLSTLHTKDAVGTVARLLNMKTEPFLLASALSGVLAQRLVRVLCPKCKEPGQPTQEELSRLAAAPKEGKTFYVPKGCPACVGQGYVGRLAIYEWLIVNRDVRSLILRAASADELRETARRTGMTTLQEDGLEKVYQGVTSLDEVIRVTYEETEEDEEEPTPPQGPNGA